MRRLMAPHSYGVLMVAEGNRPRFAALASKTTEADCLARHAIRVDGVALRVTPRFYAKEGKKGLCELWLNGGADQDFFANRLKNDHFIQIDGHDIKVKTTTSTGNASAVMLNKIQFWLVPYFAHATCERALISGRIMVLRRLVVTHRL